MQWRSAVKANDVNALQREMGAVAREASHVLGAVAALSDASGHSKLYTEITNLVRSAADLSHMRIMMDGGRSWHALADGGSETLEKLGELAGAHWLELVEAESS
jgi:hypothetical protein